MSPVGLNDLALNKTLHVHVSLGRCLFKINPKLFLIFAVIPKQVSMIELILRSDPTCFISLTSKTSKNLSSTLFLSLLNNPWLCNYLRIQRFFLHNRCDLMSSLLPKATSSNDSYQAINIIWRGIICGFCWHTIFMLKVTEWDRLPVGQNLKLWE